MTTADHRGAAGRRWTWVLSASVVVAIAAGLAAPAGAQQNPVSVDARTADVDPGGTTRVTVDVSGAGGDELPPEAFRVREDGVEVSDLEVQLASEASDPEPRTVVVALDASGSTAGPPLDLAKSAIQDFTRTVTDRGVAVGLVVFSDEAVLEVRPTIEADVVASAVEQVEASGNTALYDAVYLSSLTLQEFEGQRSIVVFSDGADDVSTRDIAGAIQSATIVGAQINAVGLRTDAYAAAPLELMTERTSGALLEVESADDLESAFAEVATDFASQYRLTYANTGTVGQIEIEVAVTRNGLTAVDSIPALSPPIAREFTTPQPQAAIRVGLLEQSWVAMVAVSTTLIGIALFLLFLLVPPGDRLALRNLRTNLEPATPQPATAELTPTTAALSRRAIELVERVPKPEGYDTSLQLKLDRASWPLRSSELTTVRGLLAFSVGGLAWVLLPGFLPLLLGGAAGWFVPTIVLQSRVQRRQDQFMDQLPDTLQLLAGSMKAGYGVLQAIDTVVKESPEPTRSEFQRVLTESRLGMPLEDSLTAMADRIGTEDFRWVAVAINIQRRVGGNLAKLLETVGSTLRERAATRRQVSALSAEGRISAAILIGLPILLTVWMLLVNPDYVGVLTTDPRGQVLAVAGVLGMVIGIVWIRNLIEIDV